MADTKHCPRCGRTYPRTRDHFPGNRSRPDGLCAYCIECHRILNRERYDARMEAPGGHVAYAQRQRENHRIRAEREGRELAIAKAQTTALGAYMGAPNGKAGQLLDIKPLRQWLTQRFPADWTHAEIAATTGLDETHVRRIRYGEARSISLHTADRVFVNADEPHLLAILYPLEEAVA